MSIFSIIKNFNAEAKSSRVILSVGWQSLYHVPSISVRSKQLFVSCKFTFIPNLLSLHSDHRSHVHFKASVPPCPHTVRWVPSSPGFVPSTVLTNLVSPEQTLIPHMWCGAPAHCALSESISKTNSVDDVLYVIWYDLDLTTQDASHRALWKKFSLLPLTSEAFIRGFLNDF